MPTVYSHSIITTNFRVQNARMFLEYLDLDNVSYYVFIGKPTPWSGGHDDTTPPRPENTDHQVNRTHWHDMIAAKRIRSENARLAIPRIDWRGNVDYQVFDVYDPLSIDQHRKAFYCYAEGNVYKCLSNNGGDRSTVKPTGEEIAPITTSDGYVWKYMFTVSAEDAENFLTHQFIPVPTYTPPNNNHQVEGVFNPINMDAVGNVIIGHGVSNIFELGAHYVILNGKLIASENGVITTNNDYRKIGLVANPHLNSTGQQAFDLLYDMTAKLSLTDQFGAFEIDDSVKINGAIDATVVDKGAGWITVTGHTGNIATPATVANGNSTATVSEVRQHQLRKYSGHVLFVEFRTPIMRSEDQVENLNLILEF